MTFEEINDQKGLISADFLVDYNYDKARWIFPGLAKRGCWVGATNPFDSRSQGTEAFGPSYLKAGVNGMFIMGPHDGGAACLMGLPTVFNYGPRTFAGNQSFHSELWGNGGFVPLSRLLLANGFLGAMQKVAHRIGGDLRRFEAGHGENAPGLDDKINAMCEVMAGYNGRILIDRYLAGTRPT